MPKGIRRNRGKNGGVGLLEMRDPNLARLWGTMFGPHRFRQSLPCHRAFPRFLQPPLAASIDNAVPRAFPLLPVPGLQ